MNITDIITKHARILPNNPAIVEVKPVTGKRDEINWAQLEERTNRLANSLIKAGIKKGEKVFPFRQKFIKMAGSIFRNSKNRCMGSTSQFPVYR